MHGKAARGPATAPRAVLTSGELPRVGYRRPTHDAAPVYSLQSMARTLRDTGLAPATIGLNLYWAAATRRRTKCFASRQFLYFRNELPTHLNFTASFRNELLTLRDPISIALILTVLIDRISIRLGLQIARRGGCRARPVPLRAAILDISSAIAWSFESTAAPRVAVAVVFDDRDSRQQSASPDRYCVHSGRVASLATVSSMLLKPPASSAP